MILSVEAVKGGVGKSTTAVYLGEALARRHGRRVLVIDADPQGTTLEWSYSASDMGEPLTVAVEALPSAVMVRRQLPDLAAKFDDVLIDCPNRDTAIITAALEAADLAVIPTVPGVEELRRVRAAQQLADAVGTPCRVLVTRVDLRTGLARDIFEALDGNGFPRFSAFVRHRADIAATVGASRPQALHDYALVSDELEVTNAVPA